MNEQIEETRRLQTDLDDARTGITWRGEQIDRQRLVIEKLRETIAAGVQENTLYEKEIEGFRHTSRRLEAALHAARSDNRAALDLIQRAGRAEGTEAAAKVADENKDPETACLIRAAAKEQADG